MTTYEGTSLLPRSNANSIAIHTLIDNERYQVAERLLGVALKESPLDLELLHAKAKLHLGKNEFQHAQATLGQLLQSDPENLNLLILQFELFSEQKQFAKAEKLILGLIARLPTSATLYSLYASVCIRVGDIKKAKALMKEAFMLQHDEPIAIKLMATIKATRGESVQTELGKLVSNHTEDTLTEGLIIQEHLRKGRFFSARRAASALLERNPHDKEVQKIAQETRMLSHPIMLIYYPFERWGVAASLVFPIVVVILVRFFSEMIDDLLFWRISQIYLVWVVSSWFVPALYMKWLARKHNKLKREFNTND